MVNVKNSAHGAQVLLRDQGGFGAFVRSSRIQAGLTQEQLAGMAAKSRRWLQDVEGGKTAPSLPSAIALANALGYEIMAERSEPSRLLDQVFGNLE
ncbi:helix-turn-helix domain-containing protein [Leucobacter sp. HY1908]